jgi:phosphate transport system substrate-binding protein
MSEWIAHYGRNHPEVAIDPNATGSGAGIADAESGASTIGGSDVYLTDAQLRNTHLVNVPLAVGTQAIYYHVPDFRGGPPLRLSGPLLATCTTVR